MPPVPLDDTRPMTPPSGRVAALALVTVLVALGALLWIGEAFDAVPLRYVTDPDDGCRNLLATTRTTIDHRGLPPLILLTASTIAAALLLASRLRQHLSVAAGRATTGGLLGTAVLGAGLSKAMHANDDLTLFFALLGGGIVAALTWTITLLIVPKRAPGLRRASWLILPLWLLPILLILVLPLAVAALTPTHEYLACPDALD